MIEMDHDIFHQQSMNYAICKYLISYRNFQYNDRSFIFSLMYNELIGGALALTKDQFIKANGWSNLYWGWGVSVLL